MTPLRLSIAMCTFQGGRYLAEQLDSIAAQSRPPDEVIVCDDGSTDDTVSLLEALPGRLQCPVQLHPSAGHRLGPAANFGRAIGRCSGDVIVLCDQDDVWAPERLAALEELLTGDASILAVFGDADLIDDRSLSLGETLWSALGISARRQGAFAAAGPAERVRTLSRGNYVTGATLAFRASMRELVLPIADGWMHDAWIGLLAAATSDVTMTPARLIRYRLHDDQEIGVGVPRSTSWELRRRRAQLGRRLGKDERAAFRMQAVMLEQALARLTAHRDRFPCSDEVLSLLESQSRHAAARAGMHLGWGRWPSLARELASGRYHRHSNGWSSVVKDALLSDRRSTDRAARRARTADR